MLRRTVMVSCLVFFGCATPKPPPADVVIQNGTIYTVNPQQPKAEAVAAAGGKIVFVGSNAEAAEYVGPNTRLIDLRGNTAMPGFTDSHYHLSSVGERERALNLDSTKNTNLEDFLEKVKAAAAQKKPGEWVTGRGWIESEWPKPVFPTRWDLDKVTPDNPVFLTRADGHAAVANSAARSCSTMDRMNRMPAC
jgi:predicted amidohydrolase YtcJ